MTYNVSSGTLSLYTTTTTSARIHAVHADKTLFYRREKIEAS